MAARIVAVLLAVGMVAGALAVRAALDRDGGAGGGDGGGGGFVLVCARELGDLCEALEATKVEDANATADRLIELASDADPELDAWLVPGPWPQMVDDVRRLAGQRPVFDESETLGWSRLVVVTRGGGLDEACARDWTCVAEASHEVAAPPTTDATGVLARAAALSARVGHTDYGSEVFEEHGGWLTELSGRLDRTQFGAGSLRRFLTTPGSADAFVTTRAAANSSGADDPARPDPPVEVALTLGLRPGASKPDGINQLALDHGWSSPQTVAAVDDGLPSPDVLYALREFL